MKCFYLDLFVVSNHFLPVNGNNQISKENKQKEKVQKRTGGGGESGAIREYLIEVLTLAMIIQGYLQCLSPVSILLHVISVN